MHIKDKCIICRHRAKCNAQDYADRVGKVETIKIEQHPTPDTTIVRTIKLKHYSVVDCCDGYEYMG